MSLTTGLFPGLVATGASFLGAWCFPKRLPATMATNHRGRQVPLTLGFALTAGYVLALLTFVERLFLSDSVERTSGFEALWLLICVVAVFGAGLYDDRRPSRVHGLRSHFSELARGRVTSGIVKVLVVAGAATISAVALGGRGLVLVVGVPLIAGIANLCNLLDVAPGRSLKFGFLTSLILLTFRGSVLGWATLGSAAVLLPLDVRERGMLGDAGSNVLGFVLGVQLFLQLPSVATLGIALAIVLILHAVAETVTLTRVIRAVPPLRWADDLWRIPAEESRID